MNSRLLDLLERIADALERIASRDDAGVDALHFSEEDAQEFNALCDREQAELWNYLESHPEIMEEYERSASLDTDENDVEDESVYDEDEEPYYDDCYEDDPWHHHWTDEELEMGNWMHGYDPMNEAHDLGNNPWIDVFGPGEEAETAYWNTD